MRKGYETAAKQPQSVQNSTTSSQSQKPTTLAGAGISFSTLEAAYVNLQTTTIDLDVTAFNKNWHFLISEAKRIDQQIAKAGLQHQQPTILAIVQDHLYHIRAAALVARFQDFTENPSVKPLTFEDVKQTLKLESITAGFRDNELTALLQVMSEAQVPEKQRFYDFPAFPKQLFNPVSEEKKIAEQHA